MERDVIKTIVKKQEQEQNVKRKVYAFQLSFSNHIRVPLIQFKVSKSML